MIFISLFFKLKSLFCNHLYVIANVNSLIRNGKNVKVYQCDHCSKVIAFVDIPKTEENK